MSTHDTDSLAQAIATCEAHDLRVVRPMPTTPAALSAWLGVHFSNRVGRGVLLDCETTHADAATAEPVQIGVVTFAFDWDTGQILSINQGASAYHEPTQRISDEATRVHNLTLDDVRGSNAADTLRWLATYPADVVLAHNAAFDRPIIERVVKLPRAAWGCTMQDVPWKELGYSSTALRVLLAEHANHYMPHGQQHDALLDAMATLMVLSVPTALQWGRWSLADIMQHTRATSYTVSAHGAAFDSKDLLKARGYQWDAPAKVWTRRGVPDMTTEVEWLGRYAYATPALAVASVKALAVEPAERFRLWGR